MAKNKIPPPLSESKKNKFLFVLLFFALIGLTYPALLGIEAGQTYFVISLSSIGILFLGLYQIDGDDKEFTKKLFKSPFATSSKLAAATFLMGFYAMLAFNSILQLTQGFSALQFFSPLYFSASDKVGGVPQTFSASQVQNDPFTSWAFSVPVAGTIEEFAFGFAILFGAFLAGIFFWRAFLQGILPDRFSKPFYLGFAFLLSILTFVQVHVLNQTYEGINFLFAAVFRLIMDVLIYVVGFPIAFTLGIHFSNNNFAYASFLGLGQLIDTLTSNPIGWGVLTGFVLLHIYVFVKRREVIQDLKERLSVFRQD